MNHVQITQKHTAEMLRHHKAYSWTPQLLNNILCSVFIIDRRKEQK
jgi:hypothetical protein